MALLSGIDYSVAPSPTDQTKSRITFLGDAASGGSYALSTQDTVHVYYFPVSGIEAPGDSSLSGMIETPSVKTYTLIESATRSLTVSSLKMRLSSGSVTAKLQINGVDITGISSVSATTTQVTATASGANSIAAGARLTLVITSASSAADLSFSVAIV